MSKCLLTIRLSQDTDDGLHGDKSYDRQFWLETQADLDYALDRFAEEVGVIFTLAPEKEEDHG